MFSKTFIVIPTVNRFKLIKSMVEQIGKYTNPTITPYTICMVDNGSMDETRTWIPSDVYVIRNPKNEGIPKAWNQGIKEGFAKGYEYFAILNNDLELTDGWLDAFLTGFKEGIHCVSLKTMHPVLSGHCFVIDRECVEKVGYFDENLSPGIAEDTDYALRIFAAGIGFERISYPIGHLCGQSYGEFESAGHTRVKNWEYLWKKWNNTKWGNEFRAIGALWNKLERQKY